jgi:hypothetical protein
MYPNYDSDSNPAADRKKAFYSDPNAKPIVTRPDLNTIPAELKTIPRWVAWKFVWSSRKKVWDKVPVNPRTRRNAKANRPDTWGTLDEAAAAIAADPDLAGIGHEFAEDGEECGFDLDGCRNPDTGEIAAWAQEIITLFGTYSEVSPSETGVKLLGRGRLPYTRKLDDREAYDRGRFFTVTGRVVPGTAGDVADCQTVIDAHYPRLFPPKRKKADSRTQPRAATGTARGVDPDDDKLLDRIRASNQGTKFRTLFDHGDTTAYAKDDSRADMALCCILAWWTRKDAARIDRLFRRSKLHRGKWDDPRGEGTYGSLTIAEAIAATEGQYDPAYKINVLIRGFAGEGDANSPTPDDPHDTEDDRADAGSGESDDDPDGTDDHAGAGGAEKKTQGRPAAANRLVELASAAGVQLFHTPDHETYAQVPRDGHLEVHPVTGSQFRRFLAQTYFETEGKAVNGEAMTTALATLEAVASFRCPERPVYRRVAPGPDGSIVLDLCDRGWRAAVIRRGGWEVTDCPPVMLARSAVMWPLPEPARGGDLADLRSFLNLKSHEDWLLVAAWLAAAIRPTGPYPMLHPKGEQGTAKTTFGRMLRRLIDPNKADMRSQPREERDLAVSSRHGWAFCFDNLSAVPLWLSDSLCRVATGGGFGTRTLYTNDEETVFDFVRPVLITSIEDVVGQPDLLDRSLAIELEPIPDENRKTEERLWAEYNAAWPAILGGLLDVVAKALELLPGVVAENRPIPRMADFAVFGEAVARALGEKSGRFLEILLTTRSRADQDALLGSPVARTLFQWLRKQKTFTGTYTILLEELNAEADADTRKRKNWPVNPQSLSGLVRRISPALRRVGVDITHTTVGRAKTRTVTITYNPAKGCKTSSASSATADNLFGEQDLSADDPPTATSSAHCPHSGTPSAPSDRDTLFADGVPTSADDVRTMGSSALNSQSHKGVKRPADDADDVFQAVSGANRTTTCPAPSANGYHRDQPFEGNAEEGEL